MFNFSVNLGHYNTAKQNIELSNLSMPMQAVLSRDERAMEAEESFISTFIVKSSPLYELFKLHKFHLSMPVALSELRWDEALHFQVVEPLLLQIT
jgi:hypothetical protein